MEFSICQLNGTNDIETEECFEANPILLNDGLYKLNVTKTMRTIELTGHLPEELVCEHCVIRWNYVTGNQWGTCSDGQGAIGCGNQETFRSCSDVTIQDTVEKENL